MTHLTPPLHDLPHPHPCMTHPPNPSLHAPPHPTPTCPTPSHPHTTPPHPSMTHPTLHDQPHHSMTHPTTAWPTPPLHDPPHPCMIHLTPAWPTHPYWGPLLVDMQPNGCFIEMLISVYFTDCMNRLWLRDSYMQSQDNSVADPGFGQGGPQHWSTRSCRHSRVGVRWVKRAYLGMGSGAHLRAPEAFGVFMAKYVFS